MSDSDISAVITADTSGFTTAIAAAEEDAQSFWDSLVDNGQRALSAMGQALLTLAGDIANEAKLVLLEVGHELAATALKTALLGTAVTATSSYFVGFWNTMRAGLTVASWFVPWLKAITLTLTAVTLATYAYQKADAYLDGELTNTIVNLSQSKKALEGLSEQLNKTATSLGIAGDGLGSLGAQALKFAIDYSTIGQTVKAVDTVFSAAVNKATEELDDWNVGFQVITDSLSDFISSAGAGAEQLRNMAQASDEVIAKQEEQQGIFHQLRAIQDGAAASAEHYAEIYRISSLVTIQAVNEEITALQERSALAVANGQADEAWLEKTGQLFAALEKQRQGILNGTVIDKAAEEAKRALAKAEEEAAAAAKHAADEQQRLQQQGADRIASLQEEIALLEGTATEAEVAMSRLWRQGLDEQQIAAIGELESRLAELRDPGKLQGAEPAPAGRSARTNLRAALSGSSEAASILVRSIGGGKSIEQIANKQLGVQQQILLAVKDNKPEPLQPLTLGTV